MPYHIKKPSAINASVDVYYTGGTRWSDDYTSRLTYSAESEANAKIANPDGKNGGFRGATVVSE